MLPGIPEIWLPRTEDLDHHRRRVHKVLTDLAPDIVEASSWEAETLHYARRPRRYRAPVVVRGDLSASTMEAFDHLVVAEKELLGLADAVLAVSEFAVTYGIPRPVVATNSGEPVVCEFASPDTAQAAQEEL
ncbi:hypothetical protein [Nocardia sp. CNY236]|uniref:hypothetical protein n=1 Tax=Nocardia sp. CNY236 TaxID=1169152 RepID=UPI00048B7AD6|nr:hypothetical protein [Nocardia sp. CNY236]